MSNLKGDISAGENPNIKKIFFTNLEFTAANGGARGTEVEAIEDHNSINITTADSGVAKRSQGFLTGQVIIPEDVAEVIDVVMRLKTTEIAITNNHYDAQIKDKILGDWTEITDQRGAVADTYEDVTMIPTAAQKAAIARAGGTILTLDIEVDLDGDIASISFNLLNAYVRCFMKRRI